MHYEYGVKEFELKKDLNEHEYSIILNTLSKEPFEKDNVFKKSLHDTQFYKNIENDIRFRLESITSTKYELYIMVGPAQLIEPNDFIYMKTINKEVDLMLYNVNNTIKLLGDLTIDDFYITRIDLAVNSYLRSNKLANAVLNILKKVHYPDNFKEQNQDNLKNIVRNSINLVNEHQKLRISIYNKTDRFVRVKGTSDEEFELTNGILCMELSFCNRSLEKLLDFYRVSTFSNSEILSSILSCDKSEIYGEILKPIYPKGVYIKDSLVEQKIGEYGYYGRKRRQMLTLIESVKNHNSCIQGYDDFLQYRGFRLFEQVIKRFHHIGLSTITIDDTENIRAIPSIYYLLGIFRFCSENEMNLLFQSADSTIKSQLLYCMKYCQNICN